MLELCVVIIKLPAIYMARWNHVKIPTTSNCSCVFKYD